MKSPTPAKQATLTQIIKKSKMRLFIVFSLAILALVIVGYIGVLADMSTKRFSTKPNIVYILTDDLDQSLMKYMPYTRKFIRDKGVSFTNYFDNTSVCCVARASILRGQYAHNTKVEDNVPPLGGFYRYHLEGNDLDNLPNWIKAAGYNTAFMGKHLNGYPDLKGGGIYAGNGVGLLDIPTGWDRWFSPVAGNPYSQYGYTMNDNGKLVQYGRSKNDYLTDVLKRKATKYINSQVSSSEPFFMYVAPYAPHSPYTPPKRYMNMTKNKSIKYPRTSAFNERSVSDKPSPISTIPTMSRSEIRQVDEIFRKRAASVRAVDDMVKSIVATLRDTNQLNNTYLIFSSDNGYHLGDHRLPPGKYTPYETDINIPLYIRGPGILKGQFIPAMAGNIDIASTLTDMADGTVPTFVDGITLLPWATGSATYAESRQYYLLERKVSTFAGTPLDTSGNSTSMNEPADMPLQKGEGKQRKYLGAAFMGVRSRDGYTYVKYADNQEEFYDLHSDPNEIYNLLAPGRNLNLSSTLSAKLEELRAILPRLVACGESTEVCSVVDGSTQPSVTPSE